MLSGSTLLHTSEGTMQTIQRVKPSLLTKPLTADAGTTPSARLRLSTSNI